MGKKVKVSNFYFWLIVPCCHQECCQESTLGPCLSGKQRRTWAICPRGGRSDDADQSHPRRDKTHRLFRASGLFHHRDGAHRQHVQQHQLLQRSLRLHLRFRSSKGRPREIHLPADRFHGHPGARGRRHPPRHQGWEHFDWHQNVQSQADRLRIRGQVTQRNLLGFWRWETWIQCF